MNLLAHHAARYIHWFTVAVATQARNPLHGDARLIESSIVPISNTRFQNVPSRILIYKECDPSTWKNPKKIWTQTFIEARQPFATPRLSRSVPRPTINHSCVIGLEPSAYNLIRVGDTSSKDFR
jgi:hypothetical protein